MKNKIFVLIKTGFFYILIGNTLTKMISFFSGIIIVRLLSKTEYATLSYADNIYSYIYLFAGLGTGSGLLKFCVQEDKRKNKAYFFFAVKIGILFQIALMMITLIAAEIFTFPFESADYLIKTMAITPIAFYLLQAGQAYLRARFENKLFALTGVIQTICVLVFTVLTVYFIGMQGIVISRYLAVFIALLIVIKYLFREFDGTCILTLEKNEKKQFFQLGFSMMVATLFSTIIPINEAFLVNNIIRDEVVTANYKVATLLPSQLAFITNSIIVYCFPFIAKMDDKKRIWRYLKMLGMVTFGIIGTICLLGYIFTPIIIRIAYGQQYSNALKLSQIFWLVYFLHAGFRMVPMNILPALGITKFNAIFSVFTCTIHFIIDYIFISKWGISGIVFGTVFVYIISGITYWIYLYRYCKGGKNCERKIVEKD